jgi:hypothetical protein
MKKLLFVLGLPIILAGCQDDGLLSKPDAVAEGDGNVTFTLSTDDMIASRSTTAAQRNSAAGGITNVDMSNYDLRYQLAIYRVDSSGLTEVISPQLRTVDTYEPVTYNLNLTAGRKYKVVVWADFVEQGKTEDLHWDTADFYKVSGKDGKTTRLNDESRDAYAITQQFEVGDDPLSLNLVLKRMLAKLRIVTTDWNSEGVIKPDKLVLTYTAGFNATYMDVVNNDDGGSKYADSPETFEVELAQTKDYGLNYDAADCNRTVLVDYIPRSATYNSYMHFTLSAYKDGELLLSRDVDTDIPTRANWLTTVMGNIFSATTDLTVECDEMFVNENIYADGSDSTFTPTAPEVADNVYYVGTANELAWIQTNISKLSGATVKLTADIDLEHKNWTPISSYKNITLFDGQGHTIYNLYVNRKAQFNGLFSSASAITIQNLTIQNATLDGNTGFNGAIVGTLGSQGGDNLIKNCTVRNFYSRNYNFNADNINAEEYMKGYYNAGAIAGQVNQGDLEDCHAYDVDIESAWRAGGLVGFVNIKDYNKTATFTNCSVENATVWNASVIAEGDNDTQMRQAGALVGTAYGDSADASTLTFVYCSASNITYKYGYIWTEPNGFDRYFELPGLLYSINEPESETYTFEYNNETYVYGPMDSFVGLIDQITVTKTSNN